MRPELPCAYQFRWTPCGAYDIATDAAVIMQMAALSAATVATIIPPPPQPLQQEAMRHLPPEQVAVVHGPHGQFRRRSLEDIVLSYNYFNMDEDRAKLGLSHAPPRRDVLRLNEPVGIILWPGV